jgi:hypothetical protein
MATARTSVGVHRVPRFASLPRRNPLTDLGTEAPHEAAPGYQTITKARFGSAGSNLPRR